MSNDKNSNQIEFHVSQGDVTHGPWTMDEIVARLGRAEISVTDFVYDDVRADWIPLLECTALKLRMAQAKPKNAPPPKGGPRASTPVTAEAHADQPPTDKPVVQATPSLDGADASEWFVQKGTHRYGPFTYLGLVKALQEKSVYEFDFVWKNGMENWVRLAEHDQFTPERIRELREKSGRALDGTANVFASRRHPRVPFDSEVIVHDNRSVWMGRAYEGSAGGSGITIENSTLVPGQVVLLHFASREDLPAFNALCEVVSKRFVKNLKDTKTPVNYSVRFLKMDSLAEPKVQEYFRVKALEHSKSA